MLQHVRAARSGAMPRRAVSPSRDCARQRSSLLIVSPRHWISIWRGMGALKGLALPMRPPARLTLWNRASPRVASIYGGIAGIKDNAFPLLARPVYMQGRAQSARNPPSPESLLATRGPQCALEPPLRTPRCVQNVEMTTKAK